MIQTYTRLTVADNSGAKVIRLINIPGSGKRKSAHVGDVVVCNVREAAPNSPVRKGEVVRAVIIRQAQGRRRPDGTYIKFDDNAAVLILENRLPRGTRIFGPVARGLQRWYNAHPKRGQRARDCGQREGQDRTGRPSTDEREPDRY